MLRWNISQMNEWTFSFPFSVSYFSVTSLPCKDLQSFQRFASTTPTSSADLLNKCHIFYLWNRKVNASLLHKEVNHLWPAACSLPACRRDSLTCLFSRADVCHWLMLRKTNTNKKRGCTVRAGAPASSWLLAGVGEEALRKTPRFPLGGHRSGTVDGCEMDPWRNRRSLEEQREAARWIVRRPRIFTLMGSVLPVY